MRKILVDHARSRDAQKRGGGAQKLALVEAVSFPSAGRELDLVALDEALHSLTALDPVQAQIVELRFFGGLTIEEAAHALGTTPAIIRREWTVAKAWLHREISRNDG